MASPYRRLPGPGGGSTKKVLALWILMLFLAAAQSPSLESVDRRRRVLPITESTVLPSGGRAQSGRSPAEKPEHPVYTIDSSAAKFRDTERLSNNADAYLDLAPAQIHSAVRAPLARSGEPSGLSSLSTARSLRDWEVESIFLLATIDGAIHARDRKTGQERWALGVPDSPMIETTHHRQNRSSNDDPYPEDDYMFIVEPSKDGNLYIQHKDPRIGLQRLGITVRSLAADTPHFVEDPPLVYIAEQESTLYMVDAASGNVLKQFNKQKTFVNENQDRSCRRISGFELDEAECEPAGILYLGRIQYRITVSSARTGDNLCTIKYSEWTPNNRDSDLQSQYVSPLDSCHIRSLHNGRIIGLDLSKETNKPQRFTHTLDSPVARVFDVVRPLDNNDGAAPLVILSQPHEPPNPTAAQFWDSGFDQSKVFLNRTEAGDWYAMSEMSYPGVTYNAALANHASGIGRQQEFLDFETETENLIGVHFSRPVSDGMAPMTISAPKTGADLSVPPSGELAKVPPTNAPAIQTLGNGYGFLAASIIAGGVICALGLTKKHKLISMLQDYFRQIGSRMPVEFYSPSSPTPQPDPSLEAEVLLNETQPTVDEVAVLVDDPQPTEQQLIPSIAESKTLEPTIDLEEAKPDRTQDDQRERSSDGDSDEEIVKKGDDAAIRSTEGEGADFKKRKTKRGRRGGKNNKKGGKKSMSPESLDTDESAIVPEIVTKDGTLHVGKLRIDTRAEKCLGNGSNGTAVFPGFLDGREVAVKRLIRSANSLAAKEIKHLLSSDENPHVIRYFGKEESQHFTYIALDLFASSLDQVIEHPERFPSLILPPDGLNVKDALRQITEGVQHLHSLKLVHRDIKPQNVLVRAVKSSRLIAGRPPKLQFVISDFGLCKPLDEGPESTFAPTANHTAAGTTGWRAPELLVDSRVSVAAPLATSATKSTSQSSEASVVDPPTGRRATKAIDIFSLGCVYYYVMTQGHHPFDVGGTSLARDLNIKENKSNLDYLRLFDYQFEADDLILQMLSYIPRNRPDTTTILLHPYYWDAGIKLDFLCDLSDRYEHEKNFVSSTSDEMVALEQLAPNVIGKTNDFLKALPKNFINEMGKQRTYTGSSMVDLLRVIRNKKNHFHDLPGDVKEMMIGGTAEGIFGFWAKRFPGLLINCHCLILERGLVSAWKIDKFFN